MWGRRKRKKDKNDVMIVDRISQTADRINYRLLQSLPLTSSRPTAVDCHLSRQLANMGEHLKWLHLIFCIRRIE